MDISKFFNVLVVTGAAATVGVVALTGCGSSSDDSSGGSAGTSSSSGGSTSAAGSTGASAGSSGAAACNLQPSACNAAYLDDENANGCCCWISAAKGPGVCPEPGCAASDTCCAGHVLVQ